MKIYTKTGDKGKTGVIGGRVAKQSIIIETIGTFDELNAALGVAIAEDSIELTNELQRIQNVIFNIGSCLCGASSSFDFSSYTTKLENQIDLITEQITELTQFILPGGTRLSANIHLARTICRRAERQLIKYIHSYKEERPSSMKVNDDELIEIQRFMNRLSDYLFVLARLANKQGKVDDIFWNKSID